MYILFSKQNIFHNIHPDFTFHRFIILNIRYRNCYVFRIPNSFISLSSWDRDEMNSDTPASFVDVPNSDQTLGNINLPMIAVDAFLTNCQNVYPVINIYRSSFSLASSPFVISQLGICILDRHTVPDINHGRSRASDDLSHLLGIITDVRRCWMLYIRVSTIP